MGFKTYQEQVQDFQKLLHDNPARAYARFGFTMFNSIEPSLHLKEKQRLGWEPRSDLDFYNLGVAASQEGDHKRAVTHYEKAVQINPDLECAWNNLAWTYEVLGVTAKQKDALQRLLEIITQKAGTARRSPVSDEELADIQESLAEIS